VTTAYRADVDVDVMGSGHVKVGDMDLSSLTRGFTLTSNVREVTTLSLELVLHRGAVLHAGAVVEVGAETAALLVELGWTPPAERLAPPVPSRPEPTFNAAYPVARCGERSVHSPHVVEHGPDQPRNCPGWTPPPTSPLPPG